MMFYTGDLFPDWTGNLFVGAMSGEHGHHLVRLVLDGERVVAEEKLLAERKARIRFVRQAADGSIYVIAGSEIWRLTPQ
jgi:glucose/arabinose dehydrogenase